MHWYNLETYEIKYNFGLQNSCLILLLFKKLIFLKLFYDFKWLNITILSLLYYCFYQHILTRGKLYPHTLHWVTVLYWYNCMQRSTLITQPVMLKIYDATGLLSVDIQFLETNALVIAKYRSKLIIWKKILGVKIFRLVQSCKLGRAFQVGLGPEVDKNFGLKLGFRRAFCLRCTKI